jgi:hypothetical protein
MFKVIGKILGAMFIIIGVAAPIAGCWLLFTRKPQVDFYLGHTFGPNTFGKLTESQKQQALSALDAELERRRIANMGIPKSNLVLPPPDEGSPTVPPANQGSK